MSDITRTIVLQVRNGWIWVQVKAEWSASDEPGQTRGSPLWGLGCVTCCTTAVPGGWDSRWPLQVKNKWGWLAPVAHKAKPISTALVYEWVFPAYGFRRLW